MYKPIPMLDINSQLIVIILMNGNNVLILSFKILACVSIYENGIVCYFYGLLCVYFQAMGCSPKISLVY